MHGGRLHDLGLTLLEDAAVVHSGTPESARSQPARLSRAHTFQCVGLELAHEARPQRGCDSLCLHESVRIHRGKVSIYLLSHLDDIAACLRGLLGQLLREKLSKILGEAFGSSAFEQRRKGDRSSVCSSPLLVGIRFGL